jgi:hypothetical protein
VDEGEEIHVQGDSSEISLGVECFSFDVPPGQPATITLAAEDPTELFVDPEDDTLLYVRRV